MKLVVVVRVDKSPMNKKVKVVELDCGHDYYVRPPNRAPRIGSTVACDKCVAIVSKRRKK